MESITSGSIQIFTCAPEFPSGNPIKGWSVQFFILFVLNWGEEGKTLQPIETARKYLKFLKRFLSLGVVGQRRRNYRITIEQVCDVIQTVEGHWKWRDSKLILLESENKKFYSWKLFFTKRCYEYSKRFVKINYFLFASRFVLIFLFALCFFVFSQLRKLRVRPSTTTTTTSTD